MKIVHLKFSLKYFSISKTLLGTSKKIESKTFSSSKMTETKENVDSKISYKQVNFLHDIPVILIWTSFYSLYFMTIKT
jgi:hypothetical protein